MFREQGRARFSSCSALSVFGAGSSAVAGSARSRMSDFTYPELRETMFSTRRLLVLTALPSNVLRRTSALP
jgi:hypothetical protein